LLNENRFRKYSVYAIGEILIVVTGIFVAIQLNNWNESRKTKQLETKTLKELRRDAEITLVDISGCIPWFEASKISNEIIINHINNELPYHDSLDYHFSMAYPVVTLAVNNTTYENLKQIGVYLISNDSLRTMISDLYAIYYPQHDHWQNKYMIEHLTNYIKPFYMHEFISYEVHTSATPRDYNRIIQNKDYLQMLNYSKAMNQMFVNKLSQLKVQTEQLIAAIDKEIAKHEKP